jgi:hypothetical protein
VRSCRARDRPDRRIIDGQGPLVRIPFTVEQFLDVFARYNEAIWPAQLGAYGLGLLALGLAVRGGPRASRAVPALLAGAWAFVGAAYHLAFFSTVNPAARLFGAAFLVQAALFGLVALRRQLELGWSRTPRAVAGIALAAYATIVYPLLGAASGHAWPRSPVFGVTPCPTTIFTFGLLLLTQGRVPGWLLVIPGLWSLVGVSAALQLGVREDLGLVVALVAAVALLARPRPGATTAAR